jgi:ferredoxin
MLYMPNMEETDLMIEPSYLQLRERLDNLPNGFPATPDGVELLILRKLFSPEEAALAAQLRLTLETSDQVAQRTSRDPTTTRAMLKSMAQRGLIEAGRTKDGLGYGLMPFVVGIYEMQVASLDEEMARLFEEYYHRAFGQMLAVRPAVHRVIPVGESVRMDMEIRPYESAAQIVARAKSWGVLDCICRKQKALIGDPCGHPIDVCMALSQAPGAFDNSQVVRALTQEEALQTLKRAAQAGLVHSVSNNQQGTWYICNCCTCSCGILRGIAELGLANSVARSAFINTVDEEHCLACGDCLQGCQFDALSMDIVAQVNELRCVGCGICVQFCPEGAMHLVRRPGFEEPPATELEWQQARSVERGLDLNRVL